MGRRHFIGTKGWDLGAYTAEVLIENKVNGTVSERRRADFDLVSPLGPDEVELVNVESSGRKRY